MRSPFFDPVIGRYVRERLLRECRVRGTSTEISRSTGYSQSYVASLLDGCRRVSEDFTTAICKYWGIKPADMVQVAHSACDSNVLASGEVVAAEERTHPELEHVLAFVRNTYPPAFLLEFEATAKSQPDKPRMQWLIEMHAQFFGWVQKQPVSAQRRFMLLLSTPVPNVSSPVPPPKGATMQSRPAPRKGGAGA